MKPRSLERRTGELRVAEEGQFRFSSEAELSNADLIEQPRGGRSLWVKPGVPVERGYRKEEWTIAAPAEASTGDG